MAGAVSDDVDSPYLELLRDRIDLARIPFSDRGSRLMLFAAGGHFAIRLAERWFKLEGSLTGYRRRPPLIDDLRFVDEDGRPLETDVTTYPHRVDCRTRIGLFTIVFVDPETLLVALPRGRSGVTFAARVDAGRVDRRGTVLRLTGAVGRSVVCTTNARLLRNVAADDGGGVQHVQMQWEAGTAQALQLNITPRLGFNRYVREPATVIAEAARAWHEWFAAVPPVGERFRAQYYYAWWVMRAGLISSRYYTTREAMTPSKPHYVGVWQWDAYFHALAYRHVSARLAQDQLRILLDHQLPDGMIPDAVYDEGVVTHLSTPVDADVTKPPLVAWTAWKLYETEPDREFLDEIYEPLVRWNRWWFERCDLDGTGLCSYLHPYSSGLDDSPLWDAGMPVQSPDLNTYLCLQQEALGRIAAVLGLDAEARMWAGRADETVRRMIDHMWDDAAGMFWPLRGGIPLRVATPFSLFPLLTARLPRATVTRLLAHLADPDEFWSVWPVPTVALNDPRHDPEQMWRGPTWVNVNYLLVEGLRRTGHDRLAAELRRRTLRMIAAQPDIYEYYHPRTGVNPAAAAPVFGWSAALFIELLLAEEASRAGRRGPAHARRLR